MRKTNCLAFALGLSTSGCDFDSFASCNPELPQPDFSEIFERLLDELGLEWRRLTNLEDTNSDEFVIRIYGFYKFKDFMGYDVYDFHVIRRELDGTWVHKPDFKESPCEIDFNSFYLDYPDNEISGTFAVRKPL